MRFHRVLSNPPFSMNYDRNTLTHTERFTRYGFAPDTGKKADLMFAEHMLASLRPGGVMAMEHVGRTALWRGELPTASFASYLVRLIPNHARLLPEYLNLWLNWKPTQTSIRRFATPGVQQVNINPTNLQRTVIELPKDTEEQRRIVDRLDLHENTIASEIRMLEKLRALKSGLMQDLLTGKVRVPIRETDG